MVGFFVEMNSVVGDHYQEVVLLDCGDVFVYVQVGHNLKKDNGCFYTSCNLDLGEW